jgi:mRNA interferase HigB
MRLQDVQLLAPRKGSSVNVPPQLSRRPAPQVSGSGHRWGIFKWPQMGEFGWPPGVRQAYATASIVTAERIVFNVKGNAYRLVVSVDFEKGIVWIKWIGTHQEYDHIDVKEVDHER